MRLLLSVALIIASFGCSQESSTNELNDLAEAPEWKTDLSVAPVISPTPQQPQYPGVSIDQAFHPTGHISLIDDDGREDDFRFDVAGHELVVKHYKPEQLLKNGRVQFAFRKRQSTGYWGTAVGASHLTGKNRTEIYVAVSGPGGVCCTNYSIVDISDRTPRSVFHSEEFGSFRNPMEIFDADGDGIYEIVQFDSCMRYFLDDCGSCSPEPRVYFKYDKTLERYVPAPGIIQDFVKDAMTRTEEWIDEEFKKLKSGENTRSIRHELNRTLRAHVADLLHIGDERRAWKIFRKYSDDSRSVDRKEFARRLANCKFYQEMRKIQRDN